MGTLRDNAPAYSSAPDTRRRGYGWLRRLGLGRGELKRGHNTGARRDRRY